MYQTQVITCAEILPLYSPVVTICTTTINAQKLYVVSKVGVYVFCLDLGKDQRLFLYTALGKGTGYHNRDKWCLLRGTF
jgi:hypothetical protein